MPPSESDAAYLWDMLNAARAVERFAGGRTTEEYLADEILQAAIERKIEIIGEAARHVSKECRTENLGIPWSKIAGQRHVLAHDYGKIEHDRIWRVVTTHLPLLVVELERLLSADEPPNRP
jgi:uncharacterized protein with HEPN domain